MEFPKQYIWKLTILSQCLLTLIYFYTSVQNMILLLCLKKLASLLRNFPLNNFSVWTIECCARQLLICFRVAYFIPNKLSKFFSLRLVHNFSFIFSPLASLSRSFEVKRALTVNGVMYKNSTYSFTTQTNMRRSLCKCNSNRLRKKTSYLIY